MAKMRIEQILSNLKYDQSNNTLIVSGSSDSPNLIISGSTIVTGSFNVNDFDSFGDNTSPNSVDLGTF